jgi:hypothetical protein
MSLQHQRPGASTGHGALDPAQPQVAPGRSTLGQAHGEAHDAEAAPRAELRPSSSAPTWQPSGSQEAGHIVSHAAVGAADALAGGPSGAMPGHAEGMPIGPHAPAAAAPKVTTKTVKTAAHGNDTRKKVGVGEVVELTGTAPGTWTATKGTHASVGSVATFTWTAPATAGKATITLKAGKHEIKTDIEVIAPNSLSMKIASLDTFPAGQEGVGMHTNVTVGPTSVSFGNVEWLEVGEGASNVTGYFKKFPAADIVHHPNPDWLPWNDQNTGLQDHASLFNWPKPWSAGGYQWNIPNKWRVKSVGGDGHVFTTTHQVFHMDKHGTTTVSKGGAHTTRKP